MNAPQHRAITADGSRYGAMGRQAGRLAGRIERFSPSSRRRADRTVGRGRRPAIWSPIRSAGPALWVTRFRREILQPGQSVQILPTGEYWRAMRRHAELVVVDCPASDRSRAAVAIAPFMDFDVLVVAADEGEAAGPLALKEAVLNAGGHCAGLVFNRARAEPPGFLKAMLR